MEMFFAFNIISSVLYRINKANFRGCIFIISITCFCYIEIKEKNNLNRIILNRKTDKIQIKWDSPINNAYSITQIPLNITFQIIFHREILKIYRN